jgi:GT2 family glycosyltransferase
MLSELFPQATVLRMNENLGVAGGLAAGLAYAALEKEHDWVWTFDHDSVPNDDALQAMLDAAESMVNFREVGILAALPVYQRTGDCYHPLLWRDGFFKPSPEQMRQRVWFADLVISSGCMVRRDVVQKVDGHGPAVDHAVKGKA